MKSQSPNRFPWFVLLFAVYPVISLYAVNISEVNIIQVIRPLLVSFLSVLIIWLVLGLLIRNRILAAFIVPIGFMFFALYGIIYRMVEGFGIGALIIGRHRILVILVIAAAGILIYIVSRNTKKLNAGTLIAFNVIAVILVGLPILQIITGFNKIKLPPVQDRNVISIPQTSNSSSPDIYYFILDSYGREDYIKEFMDYDNSSFITRLREIGFYVADCSLSNYSFTRLSLASSLNMSFMQDFAPELSPDNRDETLLDPYIQNNLVFSKLKQNGYKITALETGYPFSEMINADDYISNPENVVFSKHLSSFEVLLLNNSMVSALQGVDFIKHKLGLDFDYLDKYEREMFILNEIPELPEIPGPKFTFIHLVTTHRPFIFNADGSINSDRNFYIYDGYPLNEDYFQHGYQNGLKFTNDQVEQFLTSILKNSKTPPIIILQGDHGVKPPGRSSILLAIYGLKDPTVLYPQISPVNIFRIIFNQLFNEKNYLLPDLSYYSDVNRKPYKLHENTASNCEIR